MSALGLLLIGGALAGTKAIPWLTRHPGWLPTIGAVLVIAGGQFGWANRVLLGSRPAVWLGQICYPVYLWHWPLFAFALVLTGHHPAGGPSCALLIISVALGWATTRWVEHPIRHGTAVWQVRGLIAAMVAVVFLGWLTDHQAGFPNRPPTNAQRLSEFDYGQHWQGWLNCDAVRTNPGLGGCKRLNPQQDIEVAVIGDSHAGHLAAGLRHHYQSKQVGVAVMLHAGCFPYRPISVDKHAFFGCPDAAIVQALDHVEQDAKVKVVVLTGYAALQVHGQRFHEAERLGPSEKAMHLKAMDAGFRQTVQRLLNAGKKVVFVIDNPELLLDPRTCLARAFPFDEPACAIDVTLQQTQERNLEIDALFNRHAVDFPQVRFFSTRSDFCDELICRATDGNDLWYESRDHLTPSGSRSVLAELGPLIDAIRQEKPRPPAPR